MRSSRRNQGLDAEIIPDASESSSDDAVNAESAEERLEDVGNAGESVPMSSIHSQDINIEDSDGSIPSSTSPEEETDEPTKS